MVRCESQCGFGKTKNSGIASSDPASFSLLHDQPAGHLPFEQHPEIYPPFPLPNHLLIVSVSRLGIALTLREQTTDTISNRQVSRGMCSIPFAPAQNTHNSLKIHWTTSFPAGAEAKSVVPATEFPSPRFRRASASVYTSWTAHIPNSPIKASQ
jgi:hypothetical protein